MTESKPDALKGERDALSIELVEGSERLAVDVRQDQLPAITVGLYRLFLSKGDVGRDALQVYQFLLYTYRCQRTDRVWCANAYIQKSLDMGERRIRVAKSLLAQMTLIETVRQKDERGRIVKTYTRLNLLPNPGPSTSATDARVAHRTGGSPHGWPGTSIA